ncbi:MAG: heavy metal translocating P-type ATPase [Saccharospirillum sp.]
MTSRCYHCGLPNPDERYQLVLGDQTATFCCVGCQAAAQTIIDSGLGEYYRFHNPDQTPAAPPLNPREAEALALYDRPDVQADFVHSSDAQCAQATLMVDGVSCAACSWLIEKRLRQLPGIRSAHFNQSNHRCQVEWDTEAVPLSRIFSTLFALGYRAHPYQADEEEAWRQKTSRRYILRLGIAGIGMMQAMMNAVALYSGTIELVHEQWLRWASLFLTLPVVLIAAGPFATSAWRGVRAGQLNMDLSVSLAIWGAFLASVVATVTATGEVYFESVNMFTFFLVLGRFLEFRARTSVHASGNALLQHLPPTCLKYQNEGIERVAVRDLVAGDRIQVLAGEICPVDGEIVSGTSEFDESRLTGEFQPRRRTEGEAVMAGTLNQSQPVDVQVTHTVKDSSVNSLVQLLERAASEKPRIAELADRGSRHFVWSTLIITALIGAIWLAVEPERAFWVVISVLVVTCPCALSLATPTALAQATTTLRQRGLVITRGHTLGHLAEITDLAFDKTGTLTEGRYRLESTHLTASAQEQGWHEGNSLALANALESASEHPLSAAFAAANAQPATVELGAVERHPAQGLSAQDKAGNRYRIGTAAFAGAPASSEAAAGTQAVWLSKNGEPLACFQVRDEVRSTAYPALSTLAQLGIRCHVLTGDPNPDRAEAFKHLPGDGEYAFGLSAEDKLDWVRAREQAGARVAVVGDGINDAPVLAGATVSVAMVSGTDLAKQAADALLLNGNLRTLPEAIRLARKNRRVIRQNLSWALVYNALALPLAAMGWVTPWQAAIGMSLSSLLVVGNALRLRK